MNFIGAELTENGIDPTKLIKYAFQNVSGSSCLWCRLMLKDNFLNEDFSYRWWLKESTLRKARTSTFRWVFFEASIKFWYQIRIISDSFSNILIYYSSLRIHEPYVGICTWIQKPWDSSLSSSIGLELSAKKVVIPGKRLELSEGQISGFIWLAIIRSKNESKRNPAN